MINRFKMPDCIYEEIYQNGKMENIYCARVKSRIETRLFIPREYATVSVIMRIYDSENKKNLICHIRGAFEKLSSGRDIYVFSIPARFSESTALYFYDYLRISDGYETVLYSTGGGDLQIGNRTGQLLIVLPDMWKKKYIPVIYQIFVDRFNRAGSEKKKDYAVMVDPADDIPEYSRYPGEDIQNTYFYGGDLEGITKKLEYIKSFGVEYIYLTPIFEARSNHKYDTGDYEKIDPMFGDERSFKKLVKKARNLGIGIILDGVFNHTGDDSRYFNKYGRYPEKGAYQGKESKYFDWYNFEVFPDKYESWWGIPILPRLKPGSPGFCEYINGKGGIIEKYIKMGAAGWRLDVADELTDEFISKLKKRALTASPDAIVYGEVWENASNIISYGKRREYIRGGMLDSVMNYPFRKSIIEYIKTGNYERFSNEMSDIAGKYPPRACSMLMNSTSTHDTERLLTIIEGTDPDLLSPDQKKEARLSPDERKVGLEKVRLAYLMLSMVPGAPCIYYGDEAGMEGYSDPFNRRYFPWGNEDAQTVECFRKLGKMRQKHRDALFGDIEIIYAGRDSLIVDRIGKKERLRFLINRSEKEKIFELGEYFKDENNNETDEAILPPYSGTWLTSAVKRQ